MRGIRVLLVDDSMFFREVVSRGLMSNLPSGSVIEKASNPFEARDQILNFDPDVMVLDVEMPKMNGIEFLRRLLSQYDLPTIVLSSRPAYRNIAMEAGAYGFMPKPSTTAGMSFMKELAANICLVDERHQILLKNAGKAPEPMVEQKKPTVSVPDAPLSPLQSMLRRTGAVTEKAAAPSPAKKSSEEPLSPLQSMLRRNRQQKSSTMAANMDSVVNSMKVLADNARKVEESSGRKKTSAKVPSVAPKPRKPITLIAIGASTGGTEALASVLRNLQPPLPPIVIVQHIPPMFSRLFAERLENECHIHVKEAENGDRLENNWAYVAPGDKQMAVKRMGNMMSLECFVGEKVNGHMPSVDVMFNSVAERIGDSALGVILTGMGEDGARGLLKMRQVGCVTLGQDEESCIVYGMPRAAYEMGGVCQQLPLSAVAGMITSIANYK